MNSIGNDWTAIWRGLVEIEKAGSRTISHRIVLLFRHHRWVSASLLCWPSQCPSIPMCSHIDNERNSLHWCQHNILPFATHSVWVGHRVRPMPRHTRHACRNSVIVHWCNQHRFCRHHKRRRVVPWYIILISSDLHRLSLVPVDIPKLSRFHIDHSCRSTRTAREHRISCSMVEQKNAWIEFVLFRRITTKIKQSVIEWTTSCLSLTVYLCFTWSIDKPLPVDQGRFPFVNVHNQQNE